MGNEVSIADRGKTMSVKFHVGNLPYGLANHELEDCLNGSASSNQSTSASTTTLGVHVEPPSSRWNQRNPLFRQSTLSTAPQLMAAKSLSAKPADFQRAALRPVVV